MDNFATTDEEFDFEEVDKAPPAGLQVLKRLQDALRRDSGPRDIAYYKARTEAQRKRVREAGKNPDINEFFNFDPDLPKLHDKSDNTVEFKMKVKARRKKAKFARASRKRNQKR